MQFDFGNAVILAMLCSQKRCAQLSKTKAHAHCCSGLPWCVWFRCCTGGALSLCNNKSYKGIREAQSQNVFMALGTVSDSIRQLSIVGSLSASALSRIDDNDMCWGTAQNLQGCPVCRRPCWRCSRLPGATPAALWSCGFGKPIASCQRPS